MHCIIPAAGKGTRMRPLTWSKPKPLLPVAGRPMLAHVMDTLKDAGVDHITLITGYLGQEIVDWARSGYPDILVDFAVQESADGLASAVLLAEEYTTDSPSMVVLGDTLFSADLSVLKGETRNLIVTAPVDDPSRFGVVLMENGQVKKLVEKPSEPISNLAIVGVYYFASGRKLMEYCRQLKEKNTRTRGEYQLTDAMQLMLQNGEPFGTLNIQGWYDCGKPETLIETNRILLKENGGAGTPVLKNSVVIEPCFFQEGTVLKNSVVGPFVSCGRNVTICDSRISDSIICDDSLVSQVNLEGSVTGDRTSVEGRPGRLFTGDDSVTCI
ncbi:nucleotidyl transferase [Candidatus Fermentibacteria bacterium]|nr:MAG: nucleotidyl transferase [Candidatus Fermentibacteria bacterium]PIE52280.1 MAG: nucleotidyl transferase [Candidatus Fermentibacteria bacterium]PIE52775.1 MAG: nucleotidyl transferase [Candidatus Fermentibacteria bacterium]